MLKTESDCPSNHSELEKKLPILDLAVWMEEDQGLEDLMHCKCKKGDISLSIGAPPKPVPPPPTPGLWLSYPEGEGDI